MPFLEHGPKPFPSGCACPTEGYFLMGPRQHQAVVGAGQGGAGSAIFAQEPPSLPISPSSSPGAHLPERPPPPPLQSPGRAASSGQARQAGPLRRCAACFDSLLLPAASCSAGCLLFRPGQEEKLEASTHLHHFLFFHVSPFQLLYISSSKDPSSPVTMFQKRQVL